MASQAACYIYRLFKPGSGNCLSLVPSGPMWRLHLIFFLLHILLSPIIRELCILHFMDSIAVVDFCFVLQFIFILHPLLSRPSLPFSLLFSLLSHPLFLCPHPTLSVVPPSTSPSSYQSVFDISGIGEQNATQFGPICSTIWEMCSSFMPYRSIRVTKV